MPCRPADVTSNLQPRSERQYDGKVRPQPVSMSSSSFANLLRYYSAPSGKKIRSMVEIQKYLLEHPEYVEQGVKLSQFSFRTPRPLQENYGVVALKPCNLAAAKLCGVCSESDPL